MDRMLQCWCENTSLIPFSPGYLRCPACDTLVAEILPTVNYHKVEDDDRDFYGRNYWFAHQENDLGFSNITVRARADLSERCLHWLRTLLTYKLPPGRILELGSAHGGFVALLSWAGFEATGLELSPSIVEYARQTFAATMLLGPVEDQALEPGTFDAIVFMDVLEHFSDPVHTMRHCLNLLKPDGILVLQTPCYPEGRGYQEMLSIQDPFLELLKPDEHLFLFSRQSVRELFRRLGASYLVFEPAMFAHYDMFLVVSRKPLSVNVAEAIERSLAHTVHGRMAQALLDVDEQRRNVHQKWLDAEADRAARLNLLKEQGHKLGTVEANRNELQAQLDAVNEQIKLSEADRAERLAVIELLGTQLGKAESERNDARAQLADLRQYIDNLAADYAARLVVIEGQGKQLGEIEAERNTIQAQIIELRRQFDAAEADRTARLRVIEEQGRQLAMAQAERNAARAELNELRSRFDIIEADRAARLRVINDLAQQVEAANFTGQQLSEMNEHLRQELNDLRSQRPVRALKRLRVIKDSPPSRPPQDGGLSDPPSA